MHAARNIPADLGGSVGKADQHRGRGAEPGDAFLADQAENRGRIGLRQADMGPAGGGHHPNEGPAVGVEHRQRPQITIADPKRQVDEGPDHIDVLVPVRDHDALGPRRRAAGVVDAEQIAFGDVRPHDIGRLRGERRLVIQPPLALPGQRDEMLDATDPVPDAVHRFQVLVGCADDRGAGVVDDVGKVVGR